MCWMVSPLAEINTRLSGDIPLTYLVSRFKILFTIQAPAILPPTACVHTILIAVLDLWATGPILVLGVFFLSGFFFFFFFSNKAPGVTWCAQRGWPYPWWSYEKITHTQTHT